MKILTVVGARPNFMKAAPLVTAIREHNRRSVGAPAGSEPIQHILVHTGQHYDQAMSDQFFTDLNLPRPDVALGVGSGSHAAQTADIMKKFEEVLHTEKPDVVIVVGDVNSTVACALVTAKISLSDNQPRPLIAHVEAGLRSFDREMPEEVNRVLTDHVSDLLFVTEESGILNLQHEGVPSERVHFVGNTMIDSLLASEAKADQSTIRESLGLRTADGATQPYVLLTLHRPSNVDNREGFRNLLQGLEDLAKSFPIIFAAHPRTQKRIQEFGLGSYFSHGQSDSSDGSTVPPGILMTDPLGYLEFLCLMKHARLVVTDSGGIQEETTCLGVPCVTVRVNTERPVTVTSGTNVVAGTSVQGICEGIRQQLQRTAPKLTPEKWDGQAAKRIVEILVQVLEARNTLVARPS